MADHELGSAAVDVDVLLGPLRKQLGDARGLVDQEMSKAGTEGGRSMASRLGASLRSGLATVAKFTAATVAAGALALGGLAVAGAKAGLQTASAMEQAHVSFETMLGSAGKADKFLGKLSTFAAKTPFEFPELQTAASSLVSVGVDANKVIPIMTSLGNATAGMGTGSDGIKRATVALQQMSAAGKITGEDLNQLRDAGVPVFDLLAAATGKSKAAVAKLAQEGKLGKKELTQLFAALESGKGLERFNGLMDKQSQTLSGQISTLKDTVNMGLAKAVQPWLPTIKKGLGDVANAAGPFFDWLAKKSAELAANAPAMMDKVSSAVDRIKTALSGGGGGQTAEQWARVKDAASQLADALPQLLQHLPSVEDTMSVTATVMGFAADHIDTLAKLLPYLVAGFAAVKVAQAASNVAAVAALPLDAARIASNFALASANRQLAAQMAITTGVQNTTRLSALRGVVATAASTVATIAQSAAQRAAAVASKVMAAGQWLLNAAMSANPIGIVIIAIIALVAALVLAWKKSETFRNIVLGAWAALKGGVAAALGWLRSAIPAAWSWVVSRVSGIVGWFGSLPGKFSGWFGSVKSAATGKLGELVSWVKGLPGRIIAGLGQVGTLLRDSGAHLIQGLIDGVLSKLRAVGEAAGKIANKVKGFFGGSPVEEGPLLGWNGGKVGKNLAGMLVFGLDASRTKVAAASARLAASAAQPMRLSPAGVALAGGGMPVLSGAASVARRSVEPAPAGRTGPLVEQKVYAQPGQSAQEIGTVAGNRVLFALGGGGR